MREVNPTRYQLVNETITFFLSNREVSNYDPDGVLGLNTDGNVIIDYGLPYIVRDGDFPILVNGHSVNLNQRVEETDIGYVVKVLANGYPFEVSYIQEIDKYKVYRKVVKYLMHIVPREWQLLESERHLHELILVVGADDPDVLNLLETLAKIDLLAERKGYSVRTDAGTIQTFGQNELARRTLRYANPT